MAHVTLARESAVCGRRARGTALVSSALGGTALVRRPRSADCAVSCCIATFMRAGRQSKRSAQCNAHVTTTKQPAQVARGDKAWNPPIQPSPALSLLCTPHNISQYHTPHTTHSPYTTHHHTPHKCLSHRLSIKSKHPEIRVVPTARSPQLQKNRHRPQTNPLKTWTLLTAKWRPPHKVLFMNFRFANAWVVQQRHGLRS
jgi:hypothetical protein